MTGTQDSRSDEFRGRGVSRRGVVAAGLAGGLTLVAATAAPANAAAGSSPRSAQDGWPVDYTPVPVPQVSSEEGLLDVPGARLAWADTGGRGPCVVFLHGRSGSLRTWPYQQQELRDRGYRVITYSRRGHEGSSHESVGYSTDDLLALLDARGVRRAHLVGHAAGGVPALDAALAWPERVLSLTIVCSTFGVTDQAFAAAVAALRTPGFEQLPPEYRELGPNYRCANPAGVRAWLEIEATALQGPFFFQNFRSALDWPTIERSPVPMLLITTDADNYMTRPLSDVFASHARRSTSVTIIGCGHCPNWERPHAFNDVLVDFLRRQR